MIDQNIRDSTRAALISSPQVLLYKMSIINSCLNVEHNYVRGSCIAHPEQAFSSAKIQALGSAQEDLDLLVSLWHSTPSGVSLPSKELLI